MLTNLGNIIILVRQRFQYFVSVVYQFLKIIIKASINVRIQTQQENVLLILTCGYIFEMSVEKHQLCFNIFRKSSNCCSMVFNSNNRYFCINCLSCRRTISKSKLFFLFVTKQIILLNNRKKDLAKFLALSCCAISSF